MRYNLTLDDHLADIIDIRAKEQSVSAIDVIRDAIIDRYGSGIPIGHTKFQPLKPKHLLGYLRTAKIGCAGDDGFREMKFFFCVEKNGIHESLNAVREVPKDVVELIGSWDQQSKLFVFPAHDFNRTFTAIRLPTDEDQILLLHSGVSWATPTMDSIHAMLDVGRPNGPRTFVVSQKFISEFFDLAVLNEQ